MKKSRRRARQPSPPADVDEIRGRLLRGWGNQGGFMVKETRNDSKRYRCPWCEGWIEVGKVHLVAFPEGDQEARRHYHTGCWKKANPP
jgi:hypothetical protein